MKAIKIAIILAATLLSTLLILVFVVKNPIQEQYTQTIEMLMLTENFKSEAEVLTHYATLVDIKEKMKMVEQIDYWIQSKVRSPIPTASVEERLELQNQMQTLVRLRTEIHSTLQNFKVYQSLVSL